MKRTMRDGNRGIRMPDLESLTPLQRSALTEQLIRQAREVRARAIGAALLRRVRGLCGAFRRAYGRAARRSVAQH
jgi:hypothetical protein